ncbi:ubiquitin carboxyl-terminal hydrolase 36 [Patella vulgata]|uniref:ubiquitin carboxyl-terminal hydrolase 36 n=1 Tax=Patella vulgata TaxID=6465 RepID=UPI00217F8118|nr:ubiquitin carboxyl-terminal hydrolase 36 [Patella vulgata]
MPASASDNIVGLQETLRANLAGDGLDENLVSSAKKVLLHQIDFKLAEKPHSLQIDSLRTKYIPLNPSKSYGETSIAEKTVNGNMNTSKSLEAGDGLPSPKVVLYPPENIQLEWKKVHKIGAGLVNMGNTCFLNSCLQCLTYTPPLVNYCLAQEHANTCKQAGFCLMCELQRHVRRSYENGGHAIKPQSILQKLKMIAKHMHWGRQEDAHEFLRYVIDGLQKSCLNGYAKLDKFSKETTVVNQIFGGFLRSQVQCMKCKERSNTYDPFMDISLDIKNVNNLEKAFEKYVQPETLDNENAYMCPRCKHKVPAHKRFSIHKAPNVLTVQLKRFDYNRMMGKISRHIQFPGKLNLRPYMSIRQGDAVNYQLYGVLVHSGYHCNSGHYYCFVKSASQVWYCMNDSMVEQVGAGRVFNAEAYLLFYIKTHCYKQNTPTKSSFIGPSKPVINQLQKNNFKQTSTPAGQPTNEVGVAVSRKPSTITTSKPLFSPDRPLFSPDKIKNSFSPSPSILPDKHDKVSFGIKPQYHKAQDETEKPRLVMRIKNGKVFTSETSPENKVKISNGSKVEKSKLVPYGDDSDSDIDNGSKNGSQKESVNNLAEVGLKYRASTLSDNVVMDSSLNTTTSVPGNSKLLETVNAKEKRDNGSDKFDTSTPKNKDLFLKLNKPNGKHPPKEMELSCISSPKVNATDANWQVQFHDSAPSPCSSSNHSSTNSTSEWHVTGNKNTAKHAKPVDRNHYNWKVTDIQTNSLEEKAVKITTDENIKLINGSENSVSESVKKKDGDVNCNPPQKTVNHDDPIVLNNLKQSENISCNNNTSDLTDISFTNGVSNPGFLTESISEKGSKPETRKENCDKFEMGDLLYNRMRVDISETQHLLSEPNSPQHSFLHKKSKKHKKHKKEYEGKYTELKNESSSSQDTPVAKHKKKKQKHKKCKEDKYDSSEERRAKKAKRKSVDREDEKEGKKKHKANHDEDNEYEWVEKTVDCIANKMKDTKKTTDSHSKQVEAVPWDYYVNDNHRKHEKEEIPKPIFSTWDGRKSNSVVHELEKSSMHGYGSSVLSWDGSRSKVDIDVDKDRYKRRDRNDEYDEEYDIGKVKKVKTKHEEQPLGYNPFQKTQDYRNKKPNGTSSHDSHRKPWKSHSFHGKSSYSRNTNGNHNNHYRNDNGGYRGHDKHHSRH